MDNKKVNLPEDTGMEIELSGESFWSTPRLDHEFYVSNILESNLRYVDYEVRNGHDLGYLAGKGAIISGFQGVGKTTLVKHLAQNYGVQRIYSITKDMPPNVINKVFEEAKLDSANGGNVFIVIDEIDAFGDKEHARYGGGLDKISALMLNLDGVNSNGFKKKGTYYVFGITNFLESVDKRLIRAGGRLEEIVEVGLPDQQTREKIIQIHQTNKNNNPHNFKMGDNVVEYLAKSTKGCTPADIRSLIKHIAIITGKKIQIK